MTPIENYGSLMWTIRSRFEVIDTLRESNAEPFSRAESAAFNGRKVVEAIAFACLVAIDHGALTLPRDAKGQWSAETIFKSLKAKSLAVLPSPSFIRQSTSEEKRSSNVDVTIEVIPDRRLSYDDLIAIYQRLHAWLHEVNPYVHQERSNFYSKKSAALWHDLTDLHKFVERHFISIQGEGFFCVLRDTQDQKTKVIPLSKAVS
jgi:hypothetical protein